MFNGRKLIMMTVMDTIILNTFYAHGTLHVLSLFLTTTKVNSLPTFQIKNKIKK